MVCKDLEVISLSITEDFYEFKALFRLCTGDVCMDLDIDMISDNDVLLQIKKNFDIEENIHMIKEIVMQKIIEASNQESHINEGKNCSNDKGDDKTRRNVDRLSTS